MKIHADRTKCAGTAMCTSVAPDYFTLDPQERRVHVIHETPDDADLDDVEDAVDMCPVSALRLQ